MAMAAIAIASAVLAQHGAKSAMRKQKCAPYAAFAAPFALSISSAPARRMT
jgi:hypothetical protein